MSKRLGAQVTVVETDLFGLQGEQRTAALDALTRGDALPFAILDDAVIHTGGLDPEALALAVQGHNDSR